MVILGNLNMILTRPHQNLIQAINPGIDVDLVVFNGDLIMNDDVYYASLWRKLRSIAHA